MMPGGKPRLPMHLVMKRCQRSFKSDPPCTKKESPHGVALAVWLAEQVEEATPEEMQRLLRLIVRRLEWMPNGEHRVEFHNIPDAVPQLLINEKTSPDKSGLVAN